jgi:hypothetical protein
VIPKTQINGLLLPVIPVTKVTVCVLGAGLNVDKGALVVKYVRYTDGNLRVRVQNQTVI